MFDLDVKILSIIIIIGFSFNTELLEAKIRRPEFNRTAKGDFSMCYRYNSIYKNGKYLKPVLETVYFFDSSGNLTQEQRFDSSGKIISYQSYYYDNHNNLIHSNSFDNNILSYSNDFFYDKNDSLTERIEESYYNNKVKIYHRKLVRDKNNNIIERTDNGETTYYHYDDLNRMVSSYDCKAGDSLATINFFTKYFKDSQETYYFEENENISAISVIHFKNDKKYFEKYIENCNTKITYYDSLENEIEIFEAGKDDSIFRETCKEYKYDTLGNIIEKYEFSGDKLIYLFKNRFEPESNLVFIDEVFFSDNFIFRTSLMTDKDGKELITSWYDGINHLYKRNIINYDEFGNMIENIYIDSNDKPEEKEIYIFE